MKVELIADWRTALFGGEKTFWDVFRASVGIVGRRTDIGLVIGILLISVIGVLVARLCCNQLTLPGLAARIIHDWAALGAGVATAILGFLITGFSIFATVTRPEHFHVLAKFRVEDRPLSQFKFVFYNFLYIFAHYLFYLLGTILIVMLYVSASPVWFIGKIAHAEASAAIDIAVSLTGAGLFAYTVYILLLLRSFIWNLYQALVFAIFFDALQ